MTVTKRSTYKAPERGKPLIEPISSKCKTPVLEVKFCNLRKPYFYENSPTIPRYSITCRIDPEEQKDFLKGIQAIEKAERVDSLLKNEMAKDKDEDQYVYTGSILIKFQTKEIIPAYRLDEDGTEILLEMEDELERGEHVIVHYDIMRYTKKNTMKSEYGISFKPYKIYYCPKQEQ